MKDLQEQDEPKTRPFTDEFLFAFSGEHLAYEVSMYNGLIRILTGLNPTLTKPLTLRNALVESHATHLRNLIDFLGHPKPQPTDVVAADFISDGPWDSKTIADELKDLRTRANKEVAHLTSQRFATGDHRKKWPIRTALNQMLPTLTSFASKADKKRLHQNVGVAIEGLKKTSEILNRHSVHPVTGNP